MKLILLGDMAFFGKCSLMSNPNAIEYFSEVKDILSQADYVVGNLETPFSIKKQTYGAKSAYICSDVSNVNLLKLLHVRAVTLANNHIFDYGLEGYETTKQVLKENGIQSFGTEGKGLNFDFQNNRLHFEGFCCYSTNPLQTVSYGQYGVNEYNVSKVDEIISQQEKKGKLCIVAVHAGLEHVNYPSLDHVKAARWLASRHKMIYYGHHPHVAQGVEKKGDSLIAYSLGNFCFDDVWTDASKKHPLVEMTENNRSSFILEILIEQNEVKKYSIVPIYIGKDKISVGRGTSPENIQIYTEAIDNMSENEYFIMRNDILSKRMNERKSQRSLMWYLKRLKPRYFQLILNTRNNTQKFMRCMKY